MIDKKPTSNKIINQVTGQTIIFKHAPGRNAILEMETHYQSSSAEPPMHFHPNQEEHFEVLDGDLMIRYKDRLVNYEKGSMITIKANTAHAMWNPGFTETKVKWHVIPALDTEELLRKMCEIANSGKVDRNGRPRILILLYMLRKYSSSFRLCKPNFRLLSCLTFFLGPIFYVKQFRNRY